MVTKKKKRFGNCRIKWVWSQSHKTSSGSEELHKQETNIFLWFYMCFANIKRSKINMKLLKLQNIFWWCCGCRLMPSWFFFETFGHSIKDFFVQVIFSIISFLKKSTNDASIQKRTIQKRNQKEINWWAIVENGSVMFLSSFMFP